MLLSRHLFSNSSRNNSRATRKSAMFARSRTCRKVGASAAVARRDWRHLFVLLRSIVCLINGVELPGLFCGRSVQARGWFYCLRCIANPVDVVHASVGSYNMQRDESVSLLGDLRSGESWLLITGKFSVFNDLALRPRRAEVVMVRSVSLILFHKCFLQTYKCRCLIFLLKRISNSILRFSLPPSRRKLRSVNIFQLLNFKLSNIFIYSFDITENVFL